VSLASRLKKYKGTWPLCVNTLRETDGSWDNGKTTSVGSRSSRPRGTGGVNDKTKSLVSCLCLHARVPAMKIRICLGEKNMFGSLPKLMFTKR